MSRPRAVLKSRDTRVSLGRRPSLGAAPVCTRRACSRLVKPLSSNGEGVDANESSTAKRGPSLRVHWKGSAGRFHVRCGGTCAQR
jgi:hypothetical protein